MNKKLFLIVLTTFFFFCTKAQTTFQKTYGGAIQDYSYDMHKMPAGGYVLGGITFSYPQWAANPSTAHYGRSYVVRINDVGDTLWTAAFSDTTGGTCSNEYINNLYPMSDGGVITCGGKLTCNSSGSGHITRLDANGNILWAKQCTPGGEDPYPVIQSADGNIIVGGYIDGTLSGLGAGHLDACLSKINTATGDTIWSKTYGSASGDEWFYHIVQTPDGGFLAAGYSSGFGQGGKDIYLVKTDANGNLSWSKTYGTAASDEVAFGHSLDLTADGGYILAGQGGDQTQSANGLFLMKLDGSGNMSWAKYYTGQWAHAVKQTPDHGYIIAGTENFGSNADIVLIKTDSTGAIQWNKTYGGSSKESGWLLELANDGGYVTGGFTFSFGAGGEDQYLIKTDANGNSGCNEGNPSLAVSVAPFITASPATIVMHGTATISYAYTIQRGTVVNTQCSDIKTAIIGISPSQGSIGTTVTITGSGFNTNTSSNIVFFGATAATVNTATATILTVTVPVGADYGPISLTNTVTGLSTISTAVFTPTFSPSKANFVPTDFSAKVDFATGTTPQDLVVADMDGDGKPDLVNADFHGGVFSVLRNTGSIGNAGFASHADFTTNANPAFILVGDMDGDGKPDVILTNSGATTISIFRNTSIAGNISFASKLDISASACGSYAIAIGDIDGDGKLDIITANRGCGNISIIRNTSSVGSLSFAAHTDFLSGIGYSQINITDLDGDSKPDIILLNKTSNYISVLRNTSTVGNFSLATHLDFPTDISPYSIASGDIDGDGKIDIISATTFNNTVTVFKNTSTSGSISFTTSTVYLFGAPYMISLADMDGDGKVDMVLANANVSATSISLKRNTSSGGTISFDPQIYITTGNQPYYVASGDIDGDGKPDVISGNNSDNTLSVLLNKPIFNWYSSAAGASALQNLSSWWNNSNGTGINPADFTDPAVTFQLSNAAGGNYAINGSSWTNAGAINVPTGANLSLNPNFTYNINLKGALINNGTITGKGAVILNGTAIQNLSGVGSIDNLVINNSAGATIISGSSSITKTLAFTSGTLTTGGSLIIAAGAAITNGYNNIAGTVTLQQNIIAQRGFRIFANPFSTNTNISTVASNNGLTIGNTVPGSGLTDSRIFSNNAWRNVTGSFWSANTAYSLFIRGLASEVTGASYTAGPSAFSYGVNGVLNGSSTSITPVNTTDFILVGNPYAAPLNSSALTNTAATPYYVYTIAQGGNQTAQRTIAGTWSAVLSSSTSTPIPVLGVIAYQPATTTPYTISPADINIVSNPVTGLFGIEPSMTYVEIQVESNGNYQDKLFVRLDSASTIKGTDHYDLQKFYNDNVNLYSIADDKKLAIDARNVLSTIPLGISAMAGEYHLKLANNSLPDGTTVTLQDKFLNRQTTLKLGDLYPFSITTDAASCGEQRFELSFSTKTLATTNDPAGSLTVNVLGNITSSHQIAVQIAGAVLPVTIAVKDMTGKAIKTINAVNGIQWINVGNTVAGMLIVQISDGKNSVIKKVIKL